MMIFPGKQKADFTVIGRRMPCSLDNANNKKAGISGLFSIVAETPCRQCLHHLQALIVTHGTPATDFAKCP